MHHLPRLHLVLEFGVLRVSECKGRGRRYAVNGMREKINEMIFEGLDRSVEKTGGH